MNLGSLDEECYDWKRLPSPKINYDMIWKIRDMIHHTNSLHYFNYKIVQIDQKTNVASDYAPCFTIF